VDGQRPSEYRPPQPIAAIVTVVLLLMRLRVIYVLLTLLFSVLGTRLGTATTPGLICVCVCM
jgi:hypothetical protein